MRLQMGSSLAVSLPTLIFLLSLAATKGELTGNETDRLSLLEIKANLVDLNGVLSSWNATNHFCQWYGVKCGPRHQRVTALNLRLKNLSGILSPHLGNLTFLRGIDLESNSFHSAIPMEIGKLRRLEVLYLNNNSFSGEIPSNLSRCLNLVGIDLSYNMLEGKFPDYIGNFPKLADVDFEKNSLVGTIPPSIGNLTFLEAFWVSRNRLEGTLPDTLGLLAHLVYLGVGHNNLGSRIPTSLFNVSTIRWLNLAFNKFEGSLPSDLWQTLPNLKLLYLDFNKLQGFIPKSISNATNLVDFEITSNGFSGGIPSLVKLSELKRFLADGNFLGEGRGKDLNFLCTMTNSTKLVILSMISNSLGGEIPECIGNLSLALQWFKFSENFIGGSIPAGIGNLVNLEVLIMQSNNIQGKIPQTLGNLGKLGSLYLSGNSISGSIPPALGNLEALLYLSLFNNKLNGEIPSSLGRCRNLLLLELFDNKLVGSIPREIFSSSSLTIFLDLSNNNLTGVLPPEVGNLVYLNGLNLSHNSLSGPIPSSIGSCISMEELYLQNNFFQGTIPSTLHFMKGLRVLNISRCNLTGRIPEELQLLNLTNLSLSFNGLEGALPTKGVFSSVASADVVGNDKLCGGLPQFHLPKCELENPKRRLSREAKLLICTSSALVAITCIIASAYLLWYKRGRRDHTENPSPDGLLKVSYHILSKATGGFSSANLIGVGSFGSVYKGFLDQIQMTVAVKVLDLARHGASKSFIAECEALKNTRHRNLVKVITACSGVDHTGNDFKALVYEFMSNGSLDDWLHTKSTSAEVRSHLSLIQRVNIGVDVASALDYLHHGGATPIIHCDLKPSNVLLDEDMTGHVGDFGLTRFIPEAIQQSMIELSSSVGVKGSIGYIAPEYGAGSGVSTYGDVHSFGILLLEMFTGKRPTDDVFGEGQNLRSIVEAALENCAVEDIIDPSLFDDMERLNQARGRRGVMIRECLVSILEIGVRCSSENPRERGDMSDVIHALAGIMGELQKIC